MGNHTQLLAQGGLYQRLWQHYQQAQHWVPGGTQERGWWKMKDNNPADNLAWRSFGASLSPALAVRPGCATQYAGAVAAAFMQGIAFACLYPDH